MLTTTRIPTTQSIRSAPLRPLGVAIALLLATGCTSDKEVPTGTEPAGGQYPVIADTHDWTKVPAGVRAAKEREVINQFLVSIPVGARPRMRALLEDPTVATKFFSAPNPELARALGTLTAIRLAANPPPKAGPPLLVGGPTGRTASAYVRVTVALVDTAGFGTARAKVVRTPDDDGQPLLLLREQDFTMADLTVGLRAAARSRKDFGVRPARRQELNVVSTYAGRSTLNERYRSLLLSATPRFVAGLGTVKAIGMLAMPDR